MMIDVIIPAYNAHKTLAKTLASLALQTKKDSLSVYVVDDCSDEDYSSIIEAYNDILDIKVLKTPTNVGPGLARQYGIDHCKGDYIMFLDADDFLYDSKTIELLLNSIMEGYDMAFGYDLEEKEEGFVLNNYNYGSLHGVLYSRNFIDKNKLKFNDTRYSEDFYFNQVALWIADSFNELDSITHIYTKTPTSLTNKVKQIEVILIGYATNSANIIYEFEKRNVSLDKIIQNLLSHYTYLFTLAERHKLPKSSALFKEGKEIEQIYQKYEKDINTDRVFKIIQEKVSCDDIFKETILNQFNKFRKKFSVDNKSKKTTKKGSRKK